MKIVANERVYFEIRKGISGLKQAGTIVNILGKHLNSRGYPQSKFAPSLWKYEKLSVSFTLVVDYFDVEHIGKRALTTYYTPERNSIPSQ